MSSYGICPYVFGILHSTRFLYKRRGFAVINIDIISYLVVKNVILRFRPCWVAVPLSWKCECRVCDFYGQILYQPVGGDLCTNLSVVICRSSVGPGRRIVRTLW